MLGLGLDLAMPKLRLASGPSEAAAPTYFGSAAIDGLSGNGSLPSLALPAGWQPSHYHLLSIAFRLGATLVVNTAGWTFLGTALATDTAFADDRCIHFYGRRAQAGDTTVSVTQSAGGAHWSAQVHGFAGVYATTPVDAFASFSDDGTALAFPSVTTTGPNRLIVGVAGINGCSGYTNAALAGIVERTDGVSAAGYGQCMWTGTKAAAGAIGTTTANAPNTDGYGLPILALRPA